MSLVQAEDMQTNYIDIGPVNKAANMLATFFARGIRSPELQKHLARIDDYLHVAEDGMKMQGYNGSQLWDTAFSLQALADAPTCVIQQFEQTLCKVRFSVQLLYNNICYMYHF